MVYVIEKSLDVKLDNIAQMRLLHMPVGRGYGLFTVSVGPEPVAILAEFCLTDWLQNLENTLLYQPVPDTWNTQRTGLAWVTLLWNLFSPYSPWAVILGNVSYLLNQRFRAAFLNSPNCQPIRAGCHASAIALDVPIGK